MAANSCPSFLVILVDLSENSWFSRGFLAIPEWSCNTQLWYPNLLSSSLSHAHSEASSPVFSTYQSNRDARSIARTVATFVQTRQGTDLLSCLKLSEMEGIDVDSSASPSQVKVNLHRKNFGRNNEIWVCADTTLWGSQIEDISFLAGTLCWTGHSHACSDSCVIHHHGSSWWFQTTTLPPYLKVLEHRHGVHLL